MRIALFLSILTVLALGASPKWLFAAEPELIAAARSGDAARVAALLKTGTDANTAYGDGSTALHWVAHRDDLALAKLLLAAGAKAGAADDLGVTPLSLAALNGSAPMTELLLSSGADANAARTNDETPLLTAARVGNVKVVELLLAHKANVAAVESSRGQTALMLAVAENHADVVRALLAAGADAKARSTNRFTPLLFAAQQGNIEIARLLLAAGASVNETAPDGVAGDTQARRTIKPDTEAAALLVAVDSVRPEMALFLLEQGADPNHHGAYRTALHSAVQRKLPAVQKALIAKGANVNARLEDRMPLISRTIRQDTGLDISVVGATPFWLAASYNDLASMKLLVDAGADTKITTKDGTTPLMVAAGVDYIDGQDKYGRHTATTSNVPFQHAARDAVQFCLDLGHDINAANNNGQTALHGAVYIGGTELVQFLFDKGANINALNRRGQTPWRIAEGHYHSGSFFTHPDTGALLEKLGADTKLGKDLGRDFARKPRVDEP